MLESIFVFKREMLNNFRDKTIIIIFLIPFLIFPVLRGGLNFINIQPNTTINVSVDSKDDNLSNVLYNYFTNTTNFNLNIVESQSPIELLKSDNIDCYINVTEKAYNFIYNSNSMYSLFVATKVGEDFQKFYNDFRFNMNKENAGFKLLNEKNQQGDMVHSLENLLYPIILIMMMFQNVSIFANDVYSGERERKTFEPLLLSGIKRRNIYWGKSLFLIFVSGINFMLDITSVFITTSYFDNALNIGFSNIVLLMLSFVIISLTSVFLLSGVSLHAKSIKVAQNLSGIIISVIAIISIVILTGVFKINNDMLYYIPIINIIFCIKNILNSSLILVKYWMAMSIHIVFLFFVICWSIKYINSEKIVI